MGEPTNKVVSAFPLPPDYFMQLTNEQIKTMIPPRFDAAPNLKTFGQHILKEGRPINLVSSSKGSIPVLECVIRLRKLKESLILDYSQIIDHLVVGNEPDNDKTLLHLQALEVWKQTIQQITDTLNELNHMQIRHRIKQELLSPLHGI